MGPSTETGVERVVAQSDVKASISMQWMKNQTLTLEMYPCDEYTNPY